MSLLRSLWTRLQSMGLTFLLGFLLCIFQSSESILVKLAGNRPDPHPSSAKLLFLSELLKLLISYTLLSVERKQLWGISNHFRRRCCRGSSSASASCCRSSNSNNTASGHHQPIPLQDEEEQQWRGKRLLSNNGDAADYDDEEEEGEGDYARKHPSPSLSSSSSSSAAATAAASSSSGTGASSGSSCSVPPILLFAVPGAIYFFNNNLTFILLSLMPAPTYVVLSNLKILTTGLFSFLFLHRLLTTVQWISLGILFLSTAVSQIDLEKGLSLSISLQAFLLMILFCSLSAAASVFSEYVMKERFAAESIHLQNMKLYMFGILFNGITYLLTPPPAATTGAGAATGFFADMAAIHFMIILAYALLGLVTSAIIKFSGSITKVYASSMSMFFAALVSWLLLNDQLTVLFFVGCFGCCYALHLYYRVAPTTATATTTATTHGSAEDADEENDDEESEEERRRIAGAAAAAAAGRRDSTSSTTSSTTLAASSPVSAKNNSKLQNGVPLSSIRVVDRNEYLSLDVLDDDDHDRRR